MPSALSAVHLEHNHACETAGLADCHCRCHGAGHQNDLVARAASCSNTADMTALLGDLQRVLGGFHADFRDVATSTRGARNVLTAVEAARLSQRVGRGATWHETLLVDEALHASFIAVANSSLVASTYTRTAQTRFVEEITIGAIAVVGSTVTATNVAESHVWCSIVAEYLASLTPPSASDPFPRSFSDICYPRKSSGLEPLSLPAVRTAGLDHLTIANSAAGALPQTQRIALLRLVGAATCPDLWHHAAAVRFCVSPSVAMAGWPPARTSLIATRVEFGDLERKWRRKGHW